MNKKRGPADDLTWLYQEEQAGVIELHRKLWKESKLTLVYWMVTAFSARILFSNDTRFGIVLFESLRSARIQTAMAQIHKQEREYRDRIRAIKDKSMRADTERLKMYEKIQRLYGKYDRLYKSYKNVMNRKE